MQTNIRCFVPLKILQQSKFGTESSLVWFRKDHRWRSGICSTCAFHLPSMHFMLLRCDVLFISQTLQQSVYLWIRQKAENQMRYSLEPLESLRDVFPTEHSLSHLQSPQGLSCLSLIIHIQHTFTLSSETHIQIPHTHTHTHTHQKCFVLSLGSVHPAATCQPIVNALCRG